MVAMIFEFLDVGMGDGTFVIMGDSPDVQELALVDFGVHRLTQHKVGADDALTFLVGKIAEVSLARKLPEPRLDFLFLTHGDEDHHNKIKDLIESDYGEGYEGKKLRIGKLVYGGIKANYANLIDGVIAPQLIPDSEGNIDTEPLEDRARSEMDENGTVLPTWNFQDEQVLVYLLSSNVPKNNSVPPNPKSLCLMFEELDSARKVILMGDAEGNVEQEIIQNFGEGDGGLFLKAYALKLGHHGSKNATTSPWLNAVQPSAVFATGDFVWAHPYCETIQRVLDHHTLEDMDEHRFCCGHRVQNVDTYFNNIGVEQVGINLWYTAEPREQGETREQKKQGVVAPRGEWMVSDEDPDDDEWFDATTTFGVQWTLKFADGQAPELTWTSTYSPVRDGDGNADGDVTSNGGRSHHNSGPRTGRSAQRPCRGGTAK